jgi:hypothetical protein
MTRPVARSVAIPLCGPTGRLARGLNHRSGGLFVLLDRGIGVIVIHLPYPRCTAA